MSHLRAAMRAMIRVAGACLAFSSVIGLSLGGSLGAPASPRSLVWTRTGGPAGGIGYDVRIDPENPKVVYVTDAWAGLHKTIDGGVTWQPINEGITTRTGPSGDAIPIFCMSLDPSNSEILWAGTQNAKGVFRSEDGGAHWTSRMTGISAFPKDHVPTFRSFAVHPQDSDVVFAALEIAVPGTERTYGQVYKTTNSGRQWRKVLEADSLFRRIEFDHRSPRVVYACTGIFDRWVRREEGVFRSLDEGETWTKANDGLMSLTAPYLAIDPRDPRVLFVATGGEPGFGLDENGGVFKSTDAGLHWSRVLYDAGGWSVFGAVALAPSHPDILYAARETCVYRSEDGGQKWLNLSYSGGGYRMGIPIALDVDPLDPHHVYLNSYQGGILESMDGGLNWRCASSGYTGAQVSSLCCDPRSSSRILAAAFNGVFVSSDLGAIWYGVNQNDNRLEGARAISVDAATGCIYAANRWTGVVNRSCDSGATWTSLRVLSARVAALRRDDVRVGVTTILTSFQDPACIVVSTLLGREDDIEDLRRSSEEGLGVLRSLDGGTTWAPVNNGLPSLQVFEIAGTGQTPDVLFAATLKGVARTADGGDSWETMGRGTISGATRAVAVSSKNPRLVYAAAEGVVFKSTDGGDKWQWLAVGTDRNAEIRTIAVSPVDEKLVAVGDRRSGVYVSLDVGKTWTKVVAGLRTRAVNDLVFSPDGKMLYAATEGEGVFRLDLTPVIGG